MKVLMISTDRKIFEPDSAVRWRMVQYGQLFDELKIIVLAKQLLGFKTISLGVSITVYPTNNLGALGYIWRTWRLGRQLIDNSGDWVVTSQDPFETGLAGWLIARRRAKLNLQIHTDFLSPYFKQESLKNRFRVWLAGWLLPRADSIRVVSERIKKSLIGWPLKKEPVVLPIFVEADKKTSESSTFDLHRQYPQFDFIILMAARLSREKNFGLALTAIVQASKKNDRLGLIIVGAGPARANLEKKIKEKLSDRVILTGWVNNLDPYYRTADLFMLTSNYEGYGRTLMEAAEQNCPVLSSDIGLVGEIITKDNGLICPVGDVRCFTEAILWAATNRLSLKILADNLKRDWLNKKEPDLTEYLKKYKQSLLGH